MHAPASPQKSRRQGLFTHHNKQILGCYAPQIDLIVKKLPKIKLIEALINSNLFLLKRYIFLNMAVPGHTPSPILSVQTRDILKHTHRNS